MKRWKTKSFAARCLVAAALAVFVVAGRPPDGRAEPRAPVAASLSRADLDRIGDVVRNEVASRKIPGAVLLIQQHGKPIYLESFGIRSVATRLPMTPDTIFRIYSMSKAVTSVAAMMLVEDGKLSLDDPVSKYIPAFAGAKVGVDLSDEAGQYPLKLEPLKRPITILDLLRHTSGITYGFFGEGQLKKLYAGPALYSGDFDNAEFAERIAKLPLADQPGVRWDYGHSTDILGRVVEVASGQKLLQFEKQRLLDPLGMRETGFYFADRAKWSDIAEPLPGGRFGQKIRFGRRIAGVLSPKMPRRWESGGAGMVSTAPDYARFLQMLLNGGELDGRRYLARETVASMTSDHIGPETAILHDPFYFPGPSSGFGLGFAVRTAPPPNTTWPLGEYRWDAAGGSFYFVDPRDDMLVVFMVQAPAQGGRIQLELKTLIYEAMGKGLRKD
jgi:CubicO group peptidase (beta-lactamase class C family)